MEKLTSFPFLYRILTSAGVGFAALLLAVFLVGGFWENPADFNLILALRSAERTLSFFNDNPWLLLPLSVFATALGEALLFLAEVFLFYPFFRMVYLPFDHRTRDGRIERVGVRCVSYEVLRKLTRVGGFFEKFPGFLGFFKRFKPGQSDTTDDFVTLKAFEKLSAEELLLKAELHYNLSRLAVFFALSTLLGVISCLLSFFSPTWVLVASLALFALLLYAPCIFFVLSASASLLFFFTAALDPKWFLVAFFSLLFTFLLILALNQRFEANRLLKLLEQS